MARQARVVIPETPHHVTQRGNRRQPTFFCDADYVAYLHNAREAFAEAGVEVWAYCLMPNHVHLIATPSTPEALAEAVGTTHLATHARSTGGKSGQGICGRDGLRPFTWTRPICATARAMWAETGAGGVDGAGARLALVERASAFGRRASPPLTRGPLAERSRITPDRHPRACP